MNKECCGTSVQACASAHWASKKGSVTLADCEFGTTCMTDRAYSSKRVFQVLVHKTLPKTMPPLPVETDVCLFRPFGSVMSALVEKKVDKEIPFIRVDSLYYTGEDGAKIRLPNSREDLAFCKSIHPADKLVIYKMGMESFEKNFQDLSEKTKEMLLAVFSDEEGVREYIMLFGHAQYLFPACPFSKVSRALVKNNPKIFVKIEKPSSSSQGNAHTEDCFSESSAINLCSSSVGCTYHQVLVLGFSVAEIPSKHCCKIQGVLVHFLHVNVYGAVYAYIWAEDAFPGSTLRCLGISQANILFHCEFRTRK